MIAGAAAAAVAAAATQLVWLLMRAVDTHRTTIKRRMHINICLYVCINAHTYCQLLGFPIELVWLDTCTHIHTNIHTLHSQPTCMRSVVNMSVCIFLYSACQ